jgi:hypothetical protein
LQQAAVEPVILQKSILGMTTQTYQRLTGLVLGMLLGLAYGIPSQAINALAVPDVTFYQPPFGMLPNLLICVTVGGLAGLICAWPNSSFLGVMIAAVIGSICLLIAGTLYGGPLAPERIGRLLATMTVLLLPMFGLLGAVFTALRWLINKQVEYHIDRTTPLRRLVAPVLLICIIGGLSAAVQYPPEGHQRIREMDVLIQAGLQASDAASVPPAFAKFGETFKQRATSNYMLQWVKSDLVDWRISQPAGYQEWQLSIAVARFDNGWIVACIFSPDEAPSNCREYDRDPTVPALDTP